MKTALILVPWLLCNVLGIMIMVIYLNTIVPTLEKHGRKAPWPMMPSEFDRQIKEYEALCIEKGLPMTGWNRINRLKIAVAIGLIAWISQMVVFSLVGKL